MAVLGRWQPSVYNRVVWALLVYLGQLMILNKWLKKERKANRQQKKKKEEVVTVSESPFLVEWKRYEQLWNVNSVTAASWSCALRAIVIIVIDHWSWERMVALVTGTSDLEEEEKWKKLSYRSICICSTQYVPTALLCRKKAPPRQKSPSTTVKQEWWPHSESPDNKRTSAWHVIFLTRSEIRRLRR